MIKTFSKDTNGNVSLMFSACLLTILVSIGAAFDFSGAKSSEQDLQGLVDAATLAASREHTKDPKKLQKVAQAVVDENNAKNLDVKFELIVVDDEVRITARSVYATKLMGLVGRDFVPLKAEARSPIAFMTPVKLALVLDTTGSMEGDNMTALKSAANSMIDHFDTFDAPIAVSVVPFGRYVNVGIENKGKNWLDVRKDGTSEPAIETCFPEKRVIKAAECTETGKIITYADVRDGRNFGTRTRPETVCTAAEYELTGEETCILRPKAFTWHGCVGSREAPYNEQASFEGRRFTGVMNERCGTPLLELTENMDDVRDTINSLTTKGDTFVPAGAGWGWRTLQDKEPFTSQVNLKSEGTKKATKAMVIMTDGDSTRSQGGNEPHLHDKNNVDESNARTAAICEAAKAENIQIFTVGYRLTEATDATFTTLRNCATDPGGFFDAANAKQLETVFKNIANRLNVSRLTL